MRFNHKEHEGHGGFVIFKGIPMLQCRQCGEEYISGKWSEKIGELMHQKETLVFEEMLSVPVINLCRQRIEDSAIL